MIKKKLKNLCIGGVAILLILFIISAFSGTGSINYEKKTVELFEDGTTMTVPTTMELTNQTETGNTYNDINSNTVLVGVQTGSGFADSIFMAYVNKLTRNAELQDNGVFKLSSDEREKILAEAGTLDKDTYYAPMYIGVLRNETLGQTIVFMSENQQYANDMIDGVEWK